MYVMHLSPHTFVCFVYKSSLIWESLTNMNECKCNIVILILYPFFRVQNKESTPGSNSTLSTSDINMNRKNVRQNEGQPRNSPISPEVESRVESQRHATPSPHGNVVEQHAQQPQQLNAPPHLQQQLHRPQAPQEADFGHLEKAAEDLVDQWDTEVGALWIYAGFLVGMGG